MNLTALQKAKLAHSDANYALLVADQNLKAAQAAFQKSIQDLEAAMKAEESNESQGS